jgi:hypothetical protein
VIVCARQIGLAAVAYLAVAIAVSARAGADGAHVGRATRYRERRGAWIAGSTRTPEPGVVLRYALAGAELSIVGAATGVVRRNRRLNLVRRSVEIACVWTATGVCVSERHIECVSQERAATAGGERARRP